APHRPDPRASRGRCRAAAAAPPASLSSLRSGAPRSYRLVATMAAVVYADTRVVAWLYAGRADLIPARARALLEDGRILVSPIVALELEYLFETGRTTERARHVVQSLNRDLGLGLCDLPFPDVAEAALPPSRTPDPCARSLV